jgi:uncharacterized protein
MTSYSTSNINPLQARAAQRAVDTIVEQNVGVQTAVIASADGLPLASRTNTNFDFAKLAAMASSIAAIGSVVSEETNAGACKRVLVDSEKSYTLIVSIDNAEWPLILCVIAERSAVLAQVMYAAREALNLVATAGE